MTFVLRLAAMMVVLLACSTVGCEGPRDQTSRIDAQWHRSDLVDGLLAHWVQAAPTNTGFMQTSIDRMWKPATTQNGDLTDQARLVYSLIVGYDLTRDRRYLQAAQLGADFLLTRYRDPENGGFFLRVTPDGKVISTNKNTYAHAFALLALSHMFRVTGEDRYRKAALLTWNEINLWLRDSEGGFFGELPRDFSQDKARGVGARSQNPLMHLFEALLALHDATNDPVALQGAKKIGDFVVYRLMQGATDGGAFVPEWYDFKWKPLEAHGREGGFTDIGHQFEWIHLLLEADFRGLTGVYAQAAERILKYAVGAGYDEIDGGVFTAIYPDTSVDKGKTYWQQTEAIRAFFMIAQRNGEPDMWRRYEQTLGFVQQEFIDKKNGGWFGKPATVCMRETCPDGQVEPYHMAAMHLAALGMVAKGKQ